MARNVRVAAVQAEPVWMDLDATTDKTIRLIEEAAERGVELIAFPETWLPGFPVFLFGFPVYQQQGYLKRYIENSPTVDGPEIQRVREAAKKHGMIVVLGFSERDHGSLYMSQVIIDAEGEILVHRRKIKPTHAERSLFGDGDGSHIKVAETSVGRVGALNCFEHVQPLSKFAMYSQHEEIHVAGWPCIGIMGDHPTLGTESTIVASRVYALEGGAFVLVSTQIMSDEGAMVFATPEGEPFPLYTGGGGLARIYAPSSEMITEPTDPTIEQIVVADIDLDDIGLAKNVVDPVGHYSRPDVVRLLIDQNPRSVVVEASPLALEDMESAPQPEPAV